MRITIIQRLDDVAAEIRSDGLELAKIEVDMQTGQEQTAEKNAAYLYNIIRTIGLFAIFGSFVLAYVIAKNIANPIMKLKEKAIDIGKGSPGTRIEVESKDEIGELANAFNKMAEDLQKSNNEIVSAKEYKDNIVRSMTDTLIVVSPHGIIQTVNPAVCTLLRYEEKELIGQPISKVLLDNGLQFDEDNYSIKKELILNLEKEYLSKDLRKIPVILSTSIMYDNDGKTQGIIYIAQDITERKRSKEELQQSEEKYRNFLEKIQDGVFLVQGTKFQYANEGFAKMVGYTAEEVIGKDFWEFVAPEDREMVMDYYRRRHAGEDVPREYEFNGIHRDGTKHIININIGHINYNGRVAIIGTVKDITERRRAEEKLRLFRNLIDQSNDAIFVIDPETGRILDANNKACSSLGYRREELLSMHVFDFATTLPDHFFWKEHAQEVKKKGHLILEGQQRRKDSTILPVEVNISYISLGKNNYMLSVVRDITERKQAEEALRRNEEYFRSLIENALDTITILNRDGIISYESPSIQRVFGYKPEELIGKNAFEFIHPEDLPHVMSTINRGIQNPGSPQSTEYRFRHKNGSWLVIESIGKLMIDNPESTDIIVNSRDITERKRAEKAWQTSEKKYSTLVERGNDGIIIIQDGLLEFINSKMADIAGYTLKEVIGKPFYDFVSVEFKELTIDNYRKRLSGEEIPNRYQIEIISKDGRNVPVEVNASLIDYEGKRAEMAIIRDITERKRAEEELRKSEERFRQISESAGEWIWEVDADGLYTYSSPVIEKILGYKPQEIIGKKHFYDLFVPDVREELKKAAFETLARKESFRGFVNPNIHKNGNIVILETSGLPILDGRGNLLGYRGTDTDITEHKRSEEQVQEQVALLDKAQDAILVRNLEDCITYWNKSAERLYGWTAEEAIGKNASEILYKDKEDSLRHIEARKSVVERGEWSGELYHVTKDGREVIVESRWTLMHDNKGKPKSILVINTDITGKKKLEEQFLRSQRMESIGTLASGIAHDINNVLSPIMLSLELLKEKFSDDESQKLVNILERSATRGASLIKQVQSFTRGVEGERIPLQVAHVISEIRQIAKETFPRSIEIRTYIPGNLWTISGDATQLHQVLMNLSVNARDAMPDSGILSISAENLFIDENFARANIEARVGPHIVITVSDTGIGVPHEIQDRIFEPFFTTKEHGKGTGLGLSTALGIVKSHGGFITLYSEVEKGTTFKVYLPAITATEIQKAEDKQLGLPSGCGESILVVDDEAQIREITRAILKTHGYKVLTADDGKEAIILYSKHREEIKVVLMDMMMPVMDGQTSIRALIKVNPDIKIIAVSGLTEKDKLTNVADTHVHGFLPKPYTAERLLKTIHEVLSAK